MPCWRRRSLAHPTPLAQSVQFFGNGRKVWILGSPLLLAGGLVREQLPFPVPQCRRAFVVLLASGGFLGPAGLPDLLVEVANSLWPGGHALPDGRQLRVDPLDAVQDLGQQPALPEIQRTLP
jgi:hypothetical protein